MWECIGWDRVRHACRIEEIMNADLYVSILEDELQQSLKYQEKEIENVVFQQDNDSKHTSKKTKNWLKNHGFRTVVWPPQSPDLNPIEYLWSHVKRKLGEYETKPKGVGELWKRLQKEQENIGKEVCQNLISSMPRRIEAVLKAKGGYTKYQRYYFNQPKSEDQNCYNALLALITLQCGNRTPDMDKPGYRLKAKKQGYLTVFEFPYLVQPSPRYSLNIELVPNIVTVL